MQTQKLVYEGPDPERLLLDVWNEHGTDALISEPERFAKGGVAGFFAKTYYRVEVEPQQTSGIVKPAPIGTTAALESIIEATEDIYEETRAPATTPSPKSSFDEVLAGVAGSLGEDPVTFARRNIGDAVAPSQHSDVSSFFEPTPKPEPGPLRIFPSLGHAASNIEPVASQASTPADDTINSLLATPEKPWNDPVSTMSDAIATESATAPSSEATPGVRVSRVIRGSLPAEMAPAVPNFVPQSSTPIASSMPTWADVTPQVAAVTNLQRREAPGTISELRQAGFPAHLLALLESRGLADFALENAFALLPPAPSLPSIPGSLIAVVGIDEHSLGLAERIASSLEIENHELALAKPKQLAEGTHQPIANRIDDRSFAPDLLVHDVSAAATLSPGWRRDRVGIVAVALEDDVEQRIWGRAMLRAIRPTLTIAVVDARSKGEDHASFVASIGGVDALALTRASQTVSPAALLALGLPVLYLDGTEATGQTWAKTVRGGIVSSGVLTQMPGVRNMDRVVIGAVVLSVPSIMLAFSGGVSFATLAIRFVLALAVCWGFGALIERLVDTYSRQARQNDLAKRIQQLAAARQGTPQNSTPGSPTAL